MENIKSSIKGNILTIQINLAAKGQPSKTGKTTVIASTKGNVPLIPGDTDTYVGINVYRKV